MCRKAVCLFSLVLLLSIASVASAATWWYSAAGGTGGIWTDPNNWWTLTVPTNNTGAGVYNDMSTGSPGLLINSSMTIDINDLSIGVWGQSGFPGVACELDMTGGSLTIHNDYMIGNLGWNWGKYALGVVTMTGGSTTVDGTLKVGMSGIGHLKLVDGTIQADALSMGTVDTTIYVNGYTGDNTLNIWRGKLILLGNLSSVDARVVAYGGVAGASLVFNYGADVAGYTTITAIPEPATIMLLGLGGLAMLRRRRA